MKTYDVEHAHGAAIELNRYSEVNWHPRFVRCATIEEARGEMLSCILGRRDDEDRGEDYERGWETLAKRTRSANIGEVLAFDEDGWRIIVEVDA